MAFVWYLPQEVIERIAAGMDLRDHFIQVVAEFVDADFLRRGNENARGLFLRDPAVLQFLERPVLGLFGCE
jgi:hypothetical protein